MKLFLRLLEETPNSTASALYIDGAFCCFIVEDGHRDIKVHGQTRIPEGVYEVAQRKVGKFFTRYSKKFGHLFVPEIIGVPGFKYILFHMGNFITDTEGCLLCGQGIAFDENTGNFFVPAGFSTGAYLKLYKALSRAFTNSEAVQITISRAKSA